MQTAATLLPTQAEIVKIMQPHSAQNMIMTTNKKNKKYAQQTAPPPKQQLSQPTQHQPPPAQFQINKSYNVVSVLKTTAANTQQQQQQQHLSHQVQQQQQHQPHNHQQQQQQQQSYASAVNRSLPPSNTQPSTVICNGAGMVTVNNCPLNAGDLNSAALYSLNHRTLQSANSNTMESKGRFVGGGGEICNGASNSNSGAVTSVGASGSGGGNSSGGIITLANSHGGNALGIALGTSGGAFIHEKGLVGISVGCVDSRKYDFKNNNLLANGSFQTPQEYVPPGNNNAGNTRTNPQNGTLYRGPPPPQNSANRGNTGTGTRHVHMPTMYQPTMHQNVVLPYTQFQRTPTFQTPQFQYTHGHLQYPPVYQYQYLPTIQQPPAHQRSGVGVNATVGVGNTIPVQSGPNGPLTGPPGATQPSISLQTATVLTGAVPGPGPNAVINVGAAGAGQVSVTPLVGVMPANVANQQTQQPNRRRHAHRLQIIDPNTNKNILDELEQNNPNSENNDYQEQGGSSSSAVQNEVAMGLPQPDTVNTALGSGVVLISSDTRSNMPYNIDVNQMSTQRDNVVGQTPVVSAMSDAPSVEILSTPQKPRSKKIPIVPPKEEASSGHQTYDASLSQPANKKTIDVPTNNIKLDSVPKHTEQQQHQHIALSKPEIVSDRNELEILQEPLTGNREHKENIDKTIQTTQDIQQIETVKSVSSNTETQELDNSVISSALSVPEGVNAVQIKPVTNMQITVPPPDTKLSPTVDNEEQEAPVQVSATASVDSGNEVNELSITQQIVSVVSSSSSSKSGNVISNPPNGDIKDVDCEAELMETKIEALDEIDQTQKSDSKINDKNSEKITNLTETTVQGTETNSEVGKDKLDKTTDATSLDKTKTDADIATTTPLIESLISYNDGQWSPNNPNGKKQYNREQLMQLREAKASRIQPEVTNVSILPQTNLMPSFMRNNSHKRVQSMVGSIGGNRGNDGMGGGGNFIGKQTSMSGVQGRNSMNKGGMIHVNLSLNQDVKLNETENAWRPRVLGKNEGETDSEADIRREKDDLVRRVRGILNKLTPEKFDTLVEEIIKLKIDTPDKMDEVIVLVFEKAIDEPNFSVSYARLCHRLITEVKARDERMESGTKSNLAHFRNALLDKTEREFTQNVSQSTAKEKKLQPLVDKIKKTADGNEKAELEALLEEEERKIRRRSGGTVRFIGELFKISMLTGKIIYSCIDTLLNPQSEDMLECLCKLLTTVGAKFEQTPVNAKDPTRCYSLEKSITKMQAIASKTDKEGARVSSRVRFMLQDVIDLRKNKWQSTRNEAPKTMGQIEKETKNEQLSAQYLNYSGSVSSSGANGPQSGSNKRDDNRGGGRYSGSQSQRGDSGNLRRQQQSGNSGTGNSSHANGNNDDNTWHVQTSKGSRSQAVDTNKLEGLLNQNLDTKKMGGLSQFIWNNNASRQSSTPTTTPSNSFAALSSLIDKNSNDRDRDRDRSGPRNKGSYNKGSMERDRYGDRVLHSRTGSSQGSRENSSSRGAQQVRGMMNSSSLQKTSSHSKYIQQMPSSRQMPGKSSGGGGLYRNEQSQQQMSSNISQMQQQQQHNNAKAAPPAVFELPTESDLKLIKSVVTEMIEIVVASKRVTPTAVSCIKRIPEAQRCGFLYYILTEYLHLGEVGKFYRRYLAIITVNLVQQNQLSVEHFRLAYSEFCQFASDLIVDIPELWVYIFEFTGPLIVNKVLTVSDLWNKTLKDNSPANMGEKFLKTYLSYCTREVGPSFTRSMWKKFNLKWTDFLPDTVVIDFIESNKLEYIENDAKHAHIEVRVTHEKHIKNVVEHVDHLLKEGSNADCIIDYINGNILDVDKLFIRSLTEILSNFGIVYKDGSYKLETELFQKVCIPVLQRYIDSHEERELECLYAMQLLVHSLEHPRGLLSELFGELYDNDVIPQDSFIKWRDSMDQSAGKGVAVKGLNPFFTHVLSGETSEENN